MLSMSVETAFLWACLIIGGGSVGLTLFALNIRRTHENNPFRD